MNFLRKIDQPGRRIAMALVGMAIAGISVGIFKRAFFGVDPFQCFCNGVARVVPLSFGTVITALFMGPLITYFRRTVSGPLRRAGARPGQEAVQ